MKSARPKPLAIIGPKPGLEIHRATFHPFESLNYLNAAALRKANKAVVEIGRINGGGMESTIVAEIRRGKITRLRPLNCVGCGKRISRAGASRGRKKRTSKKILRVALERIRNLKYPVTKLPASLRKMTDLKISIGPITIGHGDICITVIWPDGEICIYCLFGRGLCIGPVVIKPL